MTAGPAYQRAALETRLAIPILFGVDAIHGNNRVVGATIFPHNVALGAVGDEDLVERIARAAALELVVLGIRWTSPRSSPSPGTSGGVAPTKALARARTW